MPLEGHWQRVNTPLRRLTSRERKVAIIAAVISVATVLALVLATVGDSRPKSAPGCIYTLVPGATGAQPFHACGGRAKQACLHHARLDDPGSLAIEQSCRRNGVATG